MNAKRRRPTSSAKANRQSNKAVSGQVRIIGGQFRRQWVPFIDADGLRPSPDRLRETLFNWIQFDLHDAKVLDLCAGSGVLGFEALSRGASWVDFIELQANQVKLIEQTAEKLKLSKDNYQVSLGDALSLIPLLNSHVATDPTATAYHLVFVDPPYDLNLWVPMLQALIEHDLITCDSLIYIEDRKPLPETLSELANDYKVLKDTKIGQIYASLIQIED